MKNLTLLHNISCALTLKNAVSKNGRQLLKEDLSLINNVAIVKNDETIEWIGTKDQLPKTFYNSFTDEIDLQNRVVTPGLIDAHTHLIFSGNRANEYMMRLSGASYEEISKAGGGIVASSMATNSADDDYLEKLATNRINVLYELGIAACEIKTGYSLTLDGEIRLLKIINDLKKKFSSKLLIHRTLMSAHAIPQKMNKDEYIKSIVLPTIDQATSLKIIDSLDVFHEVNYFEQSDVEVIFNYARKFNLDLKLHVDEFNNNGGAKLGARYNCSSVDHLLHTDLEGACALAASNTIATLLPGTAFYLGKKLANAKMLIDAGCAVAIASDFNPGSCYFNDVFQIARMSAPSLKINPAALWSAITLNAAKSLGLKNYGALLPNFSSQILVWEASNPDDLLFDWTLRPKCSFI